MLLGVYRRRGNTLASRLERIYQLFPAQGETQTTGGDAVRRAISRCSPSGALVGEPQLLQFDEPSLGLVPLLAADMGLAPAA